ncbi:MAG: Transcriptional regulator, IclR family [Ilumatobacteraceae bacterium]|nr:Transcriptional regulator, IclR family [Ilumatobacteraceae bacterium]
MPTEASEATNEHRTGAQSIERAISVMQCFRSDPGDLGITEIARSTGLNLSTAHRIVRALCAAQFMEQDQDSERYRLGPALLVLGQRALEHSGFSSALPILERLAETTGESTSLGIRRGNEVIVVLAAASRQRLRFDHAAGAGIGLHASGMGKVLLAFSGESARTVVDELPSLDQYTPSTVTSRPALVAELEGIRTIGYATNREERYTGVFGVAAPVLDRRGRARAAVGVQGPTVRLTGTSFDELATLVREAADEIARTVEPG